jgi:hypothetical protein
MRKAYLVALVTTTLVLAMASPAAAVWLRDPTDTPGRLDITWIGAKNDEVNALVKVHVKTRGAYRCRLLAPDGPNRMWLLIDVGRDGDIDVIGRFMCRKGHAFPGGWFIRLSNGSRFGASHSGPDMLVVNIGWEGIPGDQSRNHGSIAVRTRDGQSSPCTSIPCRDRAPNKGWLSVW